MKKLASILVVAVLLVVSVVPAFAAGINTYEQKLIDYVKTAYVVDGATITVPAEYFTALENVFAEVDVTEAQYNEIMAIFEKAMGVVKANNLQKVEDITATGTTEVLLDYGRQALAVLGYGLSTKGHLTDADHGLLIITDPEGNVVAELHPNVVITKTGAENYTYVAAVGVVALAIVAVAAVSVKRFRKVSNED